MKVIIYSTTTCPYCEMLKDFLEEKNISYEEKRIDQDEEAKKEMMATSKGFLGVPFTVITKDDGQEETVMGFDKNHISEILNIK